MICIPFWAPQNALTYCLFSSKSSKRTWIKRTDGECWFCSTLKMKANGWPYCCWQLSYVKVWMRQSVFLPWSARSGIRKDRNKLEQGKFQPCNRRKQNKTKNPQPKWDWPSVGIFAYFRSIDIFKAQLQKTESNLI